MIVGKHENVLQTRELKPNAIKRRKLLLETWPNMPVPDFNALRRGWKCPQHRYMYMRPHINLEEFSLRTEEVLVELNRRCDLDRHQRIFQPTSRGGVARGYIRSLESTSGATGFVRGPTSSPWPSARSLFFKCAGDCESLLGDAEEGKDMVSESPQARYSYTNTSVLLDMPFLILKNTNPGIVTKREKQDGCEVVGQNVRIVTIFAQSALIPCLTII